jgi:hypothetical protein
MKIAAIYRGDGSTIDNLTTITDDRDIMRGSTAYLGTDEHGGTGFSQWGELDERELYTLSADRTRQIWKKRTHLGKLIHFEDLNAETQKHLAARIL